MSMSQNVADTQNDGAKAVSISPEELWRADLYDMLAALLTEPPSEHILSVAKGLTGDDSAIGKGIAALSRVAGAVTPKAVTSEYNALFIGLGRGELLPYGSFYLTGFLNEKPLAKLRQTMAELGIERDGDVYEPEDHIATLCEIMGGLIRGRFGEPASISAQKEFFDTHISTWAGHFFADLEAASGSVFYAPVGSIGRALMDVETEAFRMEG